MNHDDETLIGLVLYLAAVGVICWLIFHGIILI